MSASFLLTHSRYNRKVFLSAVLCFHRITDNRIPWTPTKKLEVLRGLCGNEALSRIVLVTTMWDTVDDAVREERLRELQDVHWKEMITQGSTTFCYLNTPQSASTLLLDLIAKSTQKSQPMPSQRQRLNLTELHRRTTRQELCARLEQLAEKWEDIRYKLRTESTDEYGSNDVRKEYDDLKVEINEVVRQIELLKRPLGQRNRTRIVKKLTVSCSPVVLVFMFHFKSSRIDNLCILVSFHIQ